MAIDRAPWTALVDDDGSNLVGTIWNKDKIKTVILDPTDAAILSAEGVWIDRPLNPADFTAAPAGSWSGPTSVHAYRVSGKTLTILLHMVNTSITGTPTSLNLALPAGLLSRYFVGMPFNYYNNAIIGVGWAAGEGAFLKLHKDILGTSWAGTSSHISGIFTIALA